MALCLPLSFEPVAESDFDAMAALRLRAMRESLERLGRFEPRRARDRLASTWAPAFMRHVLWRGERVGCVTLKPQAEGTLRLDHLYLEPAHQGQGIGTQVMRWALAQADAGRQALELTVLRLSPAQPWYERLGFAVVDAGEVDIEMRRVPCIPPATVVRTAWNCIQARDWAGLRACLWPRMVARWWTSGERFVGADAFVRVQVEYPEGWSIHVLEVAPLADGRVLSMARVDQDGQSFFATSIFEVENGLIVDIDECWATHEEPANWRSTERDAGWQRFESRGSA